MATHEEEFDLVSEADSEDLEEVLEEFDLESDIEEEDLDHEAEEEDEEKAEEEDVEEEEEVEVEEEVEEEVSDVEEEEEEDFSFKDLYHDDEISKVSRKQKTRIERYCKSLNETNPREKIPVRCLPSEAFGVLKRLTTDKNATAFSSHIHSKRELYNLCGKMLTKEVGNKELFQELKKNTNPWESVLYLPQRTKEKLEIRILTTKMDVVEGLYQCRRCGSQKTYSRQVQTRSADEGMTSIIQCSKCSLVWREYA